MGNSVLQLRLLINTTVCGGFLGFQEFESGANLARVDCGLPQAAPVSPVPSLGPSAAPGSPPPVSLPVAAPSPSSQEQIFVAIVNQTTVVIVPPTVSLPLVITNSSFVRNATLVLNSTTLVLGLNTTVISGVLAGLTSEGTSVSLPILILPDAVPIEGAFKNITIDCSADDTEGTCRKLNDPCIKKSQSVDHKDGTVTLALVFTFSCSPPNGAQAVPDGVISQAVIIIVASVVSGVIVIAAVLLVCTIWRRKLAGKHSMKRFRAVRIATGRQSL